MRAIRYLVASKGSSSPSAETWGNTKRGKMLVSLYADSTPADDILADVVPADVNAADVASRNSRNHQRCF